MPSLSSASSDSPVTVLTPLDALAAELGSEAARIERDLRRDLAVGMAELRQELEAVQRRGAEMELRAVNAERALGESVRERLATVRDGESVTVEDVRPLVQTEVAKQIDAGQKPPDAEAVAATISIQIDARLTDIAERAAALVERPEPLAMPDIGAMIAEEADRREGDLVAKVFSLVPELPDVGKAVSAEFERQLSDVVIRAAQLAPPVELPDVGAAIADEFARREDALAERASLLVKVPELPDVDEAIAGEMERRLPDIAARSVELMPDVGAAVADEFAKREQALIAHVASLVRIPEAPVLPDIDAKVGNAVAAAFLTVRVPEDGKPADPEITAALVRKEVADATADLAAAFISPADAHKVAQATIDCALAAMPPGVTIDELRAVAVAEFKQQLEAIPKALDPDEIGDLASAAAEAAVGRYMPDIAQRAATLVPPVQPLPLPDIAVLLHEKFVGHADEVAARASVVATESLTAEIDRLLPEIAARAAALVPPAEIPERPDVAIAISAEFDRREIDIAARAAALVPVPEALVLPDIDSLLEERMEAAIASGNLIGPEGPAGTIDQQELRGLVESATGDQLQVPVHLLGLLDRVGNLLSQPFALAFEAPTTSITTPRQKTIKIKRDKNGDLVANVIERPIEFLSQTPDPQPVPNGLSSAPLWNKTMRMTRDENGDLTAELTEGQNSNNDKSDI